MSDDNYTLVLRQSDRVKADRLREQGVHPLLAKLYAARGVEDATEIRAGADDLLPVSSLKNAVEMGKILADCAEKQERVLIISDYDCDGATAGSVLIRAFTAAKLNFDYLVPDRLKHSYGLTPSIVDEAASLVPKPKYIITVDNGISSTYGVERAREHGIEVLVTDHHLCPAELPNARLIVNPQQPGDMFESKNIAGCGVAWYVARAMHGEMKLRGMEPNFDPMELTPYVAMGTVADVVKLDHNNRILVKEGLERIRRGECSPGILALASIAKRNHTMLTCTDIGFAIGPRVNAAGRLAHMSAGIECLTTFDHDTAIQLAEELDAINAARKELQNEMIEQANSKSEALGTIDASTMSLVVYEPDWHEGVVGIVAGRLKDDKNRPTFVLCDSQEGDVKGSGRSIEGFHLKHALDKIHIGNPGVLLKFGGHAMAAGITIARGKLPEFKAAFEQVCKEEITPQMLERKIAHDGELPAEFLNPDDIRMLDLQVWGQGFAPPIFVDDFEILNKFAMGKEKNHLKLSVAKNGKRLDVVAFGEGERINDLPRALQVVFRPSINEYNGNVTVQLMAERLFNAPALEAELVLKEASRKQEATAAKRTEYKPRPKAELPGKDPASQQAASQFRALMAAQRRMDDEAAAASVAAAAESTPPAEKRVGFRRRLG